MPTPSVISQYQYSQSINRRLWDNKYLLDDFAVNPVTSAVAGGAATGTAGDENVLYTQFGQYTYFVIGTQTTLAPALDAYGLNLAQTATDGQGQEINTGVNSVNPYTFTVGEEAAFFMQANFKISEVTGVDPLIIGFREVDAFTATLADYTDFAVIGIYGDAGEVQTLTQKATAGVTTTDTTDVAVNGVTQFAVYVDSQGKVTYQLNYQKPTVVAAFQFNAGTVLMPFIVQTQNSTTASQVSIDLFEVGFQS